MTQGTLISNISEVALVCVRPKDGAIQMVLRACRSSLACPFCGIVSRRVHSRYLCKLGDLPWEKLPVLILLQTRKFFCDGNGCRRSIFTEPLPGTVQRYARRTCRAAEALDWITLALGGQAGARLARRLGFLIDGSTLLRQVRRRIRTTQVAAVRPLATMRKLSMTLIEDATREPQLSRTVFYDLLHRYKQRPQTSSLLPLKRGARMQNYVPGQGS
jgi:hypothetical protein